MKKIFLSLIVLTLVFAGCKKDEETSPTGGGDAGIAVAEVNTAIVVKHTGSRCPPCGGWGWTLNDGFQTDHKGKAAFISAYSQNFVARLFITATATAMDSELGVRSWPTFSVNNSAKSGSTLAAIKGGVDDGVNDFQSADVIANTGFTTSIEGDKMTIDTRTKFFKEAQGQYNLAVYVLEDGVMGAQSGHPDGTVSHHHVLRGTAMPTTGTGALLEGTKIAEGTTAAGATFDNQFTFDIAGYDKTKMEVITVIWKKDLGSLDFVNASTDQ